MTSEILQILSGWDMLDTRIVVTAALAAMACALPGNFLVLRRQSMMGDALSHTTLPGIVVAFLFSHRLLTEGWISEETYGATRHAAMFLGAMTIGVFSAVLTEWIEKIGRVESSAALGVVFTTLFAVGLLLIRVAADNVHIDPDCVLYGTVETVVVDTWGNTGIPRAALLNGLVLLADGLLVILFYKELRISAFDPSLATALGINAHLMHYALMAVTAATLVAAFESVGSILVIAMLIVPAATAYLLTDRLSTMILLSLLVAGLSAVLGHLAAITLPPLVFGRLGFEAVRDASTAGMMAAACGVLFVLSMLLGPRHGLLSKAWHRGRLSLKIACEDVLGLLYRTEEKAPAGTGTLSAKTIYRALGVGPLLARVALLRLRWGGKVAFDDGGWLLTEAGQTTARSLVRSHRLWEGYLAKHVIAPDDHLHETAARIEHFIGPELRADLETELERPSRDPHGRLIPSDDEQHGQ